MLPVHRQQLSLTKCALPLSISTRTTPDASIPGAMALVGSDGSQRLPSSGLASTLCPRNYCSKSLHLMTFGCGADSVKQSMATSSPEVGLRDSLSDVVGEAWKEHCVWSKCYRLVDILLEIAGSMGTGYYFPRFAILAKADYPADLRAMFHLVHAYTGTGGSCFGQEMSRCIYNLFQKPTTGMHGVKSIWRSLYRP